MYRRLYSTKFVAAAVSVALHALLIAAIILVRPDRTPLPSSIPVNIIDLPREMLKKLPPLRTPVPPPPVPRVPPPQPMPRRFVPEKPLPPSAVPKPKKFGTSDEMTVPNTAPKPVPRKGIPEGAEQGKETGKEPGSGTPSSETGEQANKHKGPLPFLSQNEIDRLARKGMPERAPGDDSVTLDTDEFKFISYNRWLKIKVESVLKYPELAAVSGYQGTLFIKFDILKNGALGGVEVLKSSGYKILDDEAVNSIRASAPFQPLPDDWHMDRYSIRAAVIFYLGEGYIR